MVRNKIKKTDFHGQTDQSTMRAAVRMVQEGDSLRHVSELLGVQKSTLHRYVSAAKVHGDLDTQRMRPHYDHKRVFSDEEEIELADYILTASKHHHGLTTSCTRTLSYQYANKNNKVVPESWNQKQKAGEDHSIEQCMAHLSGFIAKLVMLGIYRILGNQSRYTTLPAT